MTRLIAGSAGGRRLKTPSGHSRTRPTSDRVREALFSTVEASLGTLQGSSFLDLFAGTGAVALEAASRGADPVWAIESEPRVARLIHDNVASTGLSIRVAQRSVAAALTESAPFAFEVVFADPPYSLSDEAVTEVLLALDVGGWVDAGSLIVVERSRRSPQPTWPKHWEPLRERRYGETVLWYVLCAAQTLPSSIVLSGEEL